MSDSDIHVIGAGGHAKVVIAALLSTGLSVHAVYDDDPDKWNTSLLGHPVVGPISRLAGMQGSAFIAIGDNRKRWEIAKHFPQLSWISVIHPNACVHFSAQIGAGTVICAGCVVQPDTVIGKHVIVNTSSSIDHDCRIEDFAHITPGTHLSGGVSIGKGTLVGTGSSIVPGVRIGQWSTIGAGSTVIQDIPERVTAAGVPSRIVNY